MRKKVRIPTDRCTFICLRTRSLYAFVAEKLSLGLLSDLISGATARGTEGKEMIRMKAKQKKRLQLTFERRGTNRDRDEARFIEISIVDHIEKEFPLERTQKSHNEEGKSKDELLRGLVERAPQVRSSRHHCEGMRICLLG